MVSQHGTDPAVRTLVGAARPIVVQACTNRCGSSVRMDDRAYVGAIADRLVEELLKVVGKGSGSIYEFTLAARQ